MLSRFGCINHLALHSLMRAGVWDFGSFERVRMRAIKYRISWLLSLKDLAQGLWTHAPSFGSSRHFRELLEESMLKKAIAQATHCCYINTTIDNFSSGSSASILCYMFAYTSWTWNWVQGLFVLASPDMSKANNLVSWLLAPSRACHLRAKLGLIAIFQRRESVFNDFNVFFSVAKVKWRAPGELLKILQFESNPQDALAESETAGET